MEILLPDLLKGCKAYWKNEGRDSMYRVAMRLAGESRDDPAEMTDALTVILLTWNQAAYRYGTFDQTKLERFLRVQAERLGSYHDRSILSFDSEIDGPDVSALFDRALLALEVKKNKRRSPVAVAKAFHVLAPDFFPIWDIKIAKRAGCYWYSCDQAADKYVAFIDDCRKALQSLNENYGARGSVRGLQPAVSLQAALSQAAGREKTMLKFLDEYYYAKFTKSWVS